MTEFARQSLIKLPILSAPMAFVAGGRLAAAVTEAGGLGIVGGGYGDADWLEREFAAAMNARVGCGFITWSMARQPEMLDQVLAHAPAVLILSFGDPKPFAPAIRAAGSRLICQVQTIAHTQAALECGADIIVAQGSEAGGHGATRATLTLVPEVADLLARASPTTLLIAAGGIADGRGLAACLMLGADGVMLGSRLWASAEAWSIPITNVRQWPPTETVPFAKNLLTSHAVMTGRKSLQDGYCERHSSRAGKVGKRSTAQWRKPSAPAIWQLGLKDGQRKAVYLWARQSE